MYNPIQLSLLISDMAVNLRSKGFGMILSSPSGGGKLSLARALLKIDSGLKLSISSTTRLPRFSEVESIDYYFKTKQEFHELIEQDLLLEYTSIYNNYYGTLKKPVLESLKAGFDLLFDIDWQGARSIKKHMPEIVTVFILPPSLNTLKQRLENREDDKDIIALRMSTASAEMKNAKEYDYVVVNSDFDSALNQIHDILTAERTRRSRLDRLDEFLSNS
jgi:guanylate kinase